MNVKRDEGGCLRTYIRCFNDAMLEMTKVILDTTMASLINRFRNSKLSTSLMEPPEDVEDMMDQTEKYINAKEDLELKYAGREYDKMIEKEEIRKRMDKILRREEKEKHHNPI